ncbi:MAG: helix-turn-helix transcriptional regulator [Bacilli bacterium]
MNGERLKELRLKKGMKQQDLAVLLNLTKSSICCYEKGTRTPTIETLLDIISLFNVSSDYLIGNDMFISIKNPKKIMPMTNEEVMFIKELRKNKYISEILLEDAVRSLDLLKKKL